MKAERLAKIEAYLNDFVATDWTVNTRAIGNALLAAYREAQEDIDTLQVAIKVLMDDPILFGMISRTRREKYEALTAPTWPSRREQT